MEGMDVEGEKDNPLENPLVLRHIFSNLKTDDQKIFREICTQWRNVTLNDWRKNSQVTIHDVASCYEPYIQGITFKRFVEIMKLSRRIGGTDLPYQFHTKRFECFKIIHHCHYPKLAVLGNKKHSKGYSADYSYYSPKSVELKEIELFWRVCGPSIRELKMVNCDVIGSILEGLRWILLKKCPNLTKLSIDPRSIVEKSKSETGIIKIDLTGEPRPTKPKTTPYLQSLSLKTKTCSVLSVGDTLFNNLNLSEAKEILNLAPNLKNLRVEGGAIGIISALKFRSPSTKQHLKLERIELLFNSRQLESADDLNSSFTSLVEYVEEAKHKIKVFKSNLDLELLRQSPYFPFHKFIQRCENSLTRLQLEIYREKYSDSWFNDLTGLNFPCLTHFNLVFGEKHRLREVRTTVKDFPEGLDDYLKFDFGTFRGMPALQVFHCSTLAFPEQWKNGGRVLTADDLEYMGSPKLWNMKNSKDGTIDLPHLQEFGFFLGCKFSVDAVTKLASWMKNLKTLETILDDDTFSILQDAWPKLDKVIALNKSTISDEMLNREWSPSYRTVERVSIFHPFCFTKL